MPAPWCIFFYAKTNFILFFLSLLSCPPPPFIEDELQLPALHHPALCGCTAGCHRDRHHPFHESLPGTTLVRWPTPHFHQPGWSKRPGHSWEGWRFSYQHLHWPQLSWLQQQLHAARGCANLPSSLADGPRLWPKVSERPGPGPTRQSGRGGGQVVSTCWATENGLRVTAQGAKQSGSRSEHTPDRTGSPHTGKTPTYMHKYDEYQ